MLGQSIINTNTVNFEVDFLRKYKPIRDGDRLQDGLFRAQRLVQQFVVNPTVRGLLVYHGLGSGKTTTGIASAIKLGRPTIIWCAAALTHIFVREYGYIKGIIARDNPDLSAKEMRQLKKRMLEEDHITFATMNASNKVDQLKRAAYRLTKKLKSTGHLEGLTIVADECHKLFSVISNGTPDGIRLYKMLRNTEDVKLIFMSGTPITNDPFEVAIMSNILSLREFAMMEDYDRFYNSFIYISPETGDMELINVKTIKERLVGIVSHFPGHELDADKSLFPRNDGLSVVRVNMSTPQWSLYSAYRREEIMEASRQNRKSTQTMFGNKSDGFSTYRIKTRIAGIFVPPGNITKKYGAATTLQQDVYDDVNDSALKMARLDMVSPKYAAILKKIDSDKKRKALIYSAFLNGGGLKMFGRILKVNGWSEFDPAEPETIKKYKTFCIWSGELSESERRNIQNVFNSSDNLRGEQIRVIMISPAGTEGLSLMGIRDVHLLEPHWNITRLRQVIGRALRYKSHVNLPPKEQSVKSYLYFAIQPKKVLKNIKAQIAAEKDKAEKAEIIDRARTTDESIFLNAQRKQKPIDEILDVLKSVSIDCSYYRRPTSNYKCFACAPLETNAVLNYETVEEQMVEKDHCVSPIELPIRLMKKIKVKGELDMYKYKGKTYLKIPELKPPQFVEVQKK